jgi:hypothetical protein
MQTNKLKTISLVTFIAVLLLVIINPAKTKYETVETNYLMSARHDAEVLGNRVVVKIDDRTMLSYGKGVCDVLNTKGKTGNDAVEYVADEAFTKKNTGEENLQIVDIVISNAIRHLCPSHIALLD